MKRPRHLGSTYRLQLNGLGFEGAAALVPFLHHLGVETCYLSPVTTAAPGSSHGYDVVDPTALDPTLGGAAGFETLLSALAAHDLRALVDIVPNHMSIDQANPFFADVLRHGAESTYASYFDIEWDRAGGKVVLCILDESLDRTLAAGRLTVECDPATEQAWFRYAGRRLPIDPATPLSGPPAGRDEIERLLGEQHYRLADWREAAWEVNYRRFFAINELIGVRQEDPAVFAATHRLVGELSRDRRVAGFRVDHVDGMRDPAQYLQRLRDLTGSGGNERVIEVEKILARGEPLPRWAIDGTTGYEFAAATTGLLVDAGGATRLAADLSASTGDRRSFADRAVAAKARALTTMFPGQVDELARRLTASRADEDRDVTRSAVEMLSACLHVYRTYRREHEPMSAVDMGRVVAAAAAAGRSLAGPERGALDRVVHVLTGASGARGAGAAVVASWQQLTPAAVAKGVEDTAMYDAGSLLAVADVGMEPDRAAWTVPDWHAAMVERRRDWPLSMNAASTHDSKRSLDVRCRLAVLSELPSEWRRTRDEIDVVVGASVDGDALMPAVDAAARDYLYQTLVGAWPLGGARADDFEARVRDHVVKAAREAARHTGWTDPDESYESAYRDLASLIITGDARHIVERIVAEIETAGASNSLAAVVLAATAPGTPDIYQGDDVWMWALVDPDNRRPVDWAARRKDLSDRAGSETAAVAALLDSWRDGRIKQAVLRSCLILRRRLGGWFDEAAYRPLEVRGNAADHLVAHARELDGACLVVVVSRLPYTLAGAGRFPVGTELWAGTEVEIPGVDAPWVDGLTGERVGQLSGWRPVGQLLDALPIAVVMSGR